MSGRPAAAETMRAAAETLTELAVPFEADVAAVADALPALDPATLPAGDVAPARVLPIDESPRTALAVQHRDGHLFVFLPPMSHLEDALELVGAVEGAAAETGHAVVLEGYPLPGDDRVRTMSVTPDPGVIEVNVAPTASWAR